MNPCGRSVCGSSVGGAVLNRRMLASVCVSIAIVVMTNGKPSSTNLEAQLFVYDRLCPRQGFRNAAHLKIRIVSTAFGLRFETINAALEQTITSHVNLGAAFAVGRNLLFKQQHRSSLSVRV